MKNLFHRGATHRAPRGLVTVFTAAMLVMASCNLDDSGNNNNSGGGGGGGGGGSLAAPEPVMRAESETSLSVSWDAVEGAASYDLYHSEGSNIDSATLESGVTSPWVLTGAASGKVYYVWLKARGSSGNESGYADINGAIVDNSALTDALAWIKTYSLSNGFYTVLLRADAAITPTELDYTGKAVTVSLRGMGSERTLSFASESPSYSLFTVKSGVTLTLEDDVKLLGNQYAAAKSLVEVDGGRFVMNGGTITGNKSSGNGGGVCVASGSLIMNGGTISENIAYDIFGTLDGGGVYVKGTFTMNGGTISGNNSSGYGGGVSVDGSFTMNGGAINGNTANHHGGGAYVDGTFTMNGGTISSNTGSSGGGVYADTFTMTGGTISGNTANFYGGGGVRAGTFTMTGGTISGNTDNSDNGFGGGGVCASTFTKTGGVIYGSDAADGKRNTASSDAKGHAVYAYSKKRNTTAGVNTPMDSEKSGAAGGWE